MDTVQVLASLPIFTGLDADFIRQLAGRLHPQRAAAGEVLFNKGEPGSALYIIVAGMIRIIIADPHGRELTLSQNGPGEVIGELSLISGEPRAATAIALTQAELWRLDRADLLDLLSHQPPEVGERLRQASAGLRQEYCRRTLRLRPLFAALDDSALAEVARRLTPCHLAAGETLFRRGDPGDALYVIHSGWVKIVTADASGAEVVLNQCGPGDVIGDMSVLDDNPRSAGVVALTETEMLALSRSDFLTILTQNPAWAIEIIRHVSGRLRFATTYIEQFTGWSLEVARGNYAQTLANISDTQSAIVDGRASAETKAGLLLAAFQQMVRDIQQREEHLRQQVQALTIEIDQARRRQVVEKVTRTDFFAELKAKVQELRGQHHEEDTHAAPD